jgi:hypothetical protein
MEGGAGSGSGFIELPLPPWPTAPGTVVVGHGARAPGVVGRDTDSCRCAPRRHEFGPTWQ